MARKRKYIASKYYKLLEESAEAYYWAGFLMADGNLTNNRIDISIDKEDYDHLKKFADFVGYNGYLQPKGSTNTVRVSFVEDITLLKNKFDFKDRKTYNPPDNLKIKDDDLFLAFFCGFVDGDGNIHNKTRKGKSRESCSLFIMCHISWKNNLESICRRVSEILNRRDYIKECKISKRDESYIYLQDMPYLVELKKRIINLGLDKTFLKRKWNKINLNYSNKQFRVANERIKLVKKLIEESRDKNEISNIVGITEVQIRKIIKYLGIETKRSSFKRKPWTKEEITLLEKHYPNCTGKEINKYISHRSYDAISKMYSKLRREKNES